MNTKIQFCILILILFSKIINAQSNYQLGVLPVANINKKLNDELKLNFKIESRQIVYKEKGFDLEHELIDFSTILAKKVGLNSSLAGGYLLRVRDNKITHRLLQQFVITQKQTILRVAHRFSSDQTFSKESITYRMRYRISGQIPLNGQSVNPREFYLKINNEYLNSWKDGHYDLEIRLALSLGYEFNDNNKIEFSFENRSDAFIENQLRNRSWINMGWFVSI